MNKRLVCIPLGNHKLGETIPNTSFPPVITCPENVPCAKEKLCYAMQSYNQYPNVRNAWENNLRIYLKNPNQYFEQINQFLQSKFYPYFRYMVGGDIPNTRYFLGMIDLAIGNPQTSFLCFTKNYSILTLKRKDLPKNLNIIASAWPKYPMPKYVKDFGYRIAYMWDTRETRIPNNSLVCKGKCNTCYNCFNSKEKRDVVLPLHGHKAKKGKRK